jgi:hypothetical protein
MVELRQGRLPQAWKLYKARMLSLNHDILFEQTKTKYILNLEIF